MHALILLGFAACLLWSVGVLVAVVADLLWFTRAARLRGRSWRPKSSPPSAGVAGSGAPITGSHPGGGESSSSARRSDADPAAAQDQP